MRPLADGQRAAGVSRPGLVSRDLAAGEAVSAFRLRVYRHLLLAHGVAYQTIHALQPHANVGAALAIRHFQPSDPQRRLDRLAAGIKRYVGEDVWLRSVADGRVRVPAGGKRLSSCLAHSMDFIGVNYYTSDLVRFTPDPRPLFGREHYAPDAEFSDSGWRGIYSQFAPEGCTRSYRELGVYASADLHH